MIASTAYVRPLPRNVPAIRVFLVRQGTFKSDFKRVQAKVAADYGLGRSRRLSVSLRDENARLNERGSSGDARLTTEGPPLLPGFPSTRVTAFVRLANRIFLSTSSLGDLLPDVSTLLR